MRLPEFIVSKCGATLIEIVIAMLFLSALVASISVIFPKMSELAFQNRRAWIANNFALSKIQDIKKSSYLLVVDSTQPGLNSASLTPPPASVITQQWYPLPPASSPCDCSKADFTKIPDPYVGGSTSPPGSPTANYVDQKTYAGILYTISTCVNQTSNVAVPGTWTPQCETLGPGDPGTKHIRVNVRWRDHSGFRSTDAEDLVTRS